MVRNERGRAQHKQANDRGERKELAEHFPSVVTLALPSFAAGLRERSGGNTALV
jgi:hypothetical protein